MATGGRWVRPCAAEWRTPAERRAARRWAVASADGAIRRLSRRLSELRAAAAAFCVPGVRERLAAAAPALADLCRGQPATSAARLRRNVALHAVELPGPSAPLAAWRKAQRGPRLGACAAGVVVDAHRPRSVLAYRIGDGRGKPRMVGVDPGGQGRVLAVDPLGAHVRPLAGDHADVQARPRAVELRGQGRLLDVEPLDAHVGAVAGDPADVQARGLAVDPGGQGSLLGVEPLDAASSGAEAAVLGARRLQLAEAAGWALAGLRETCKLKPKTERRRAASQAAASVLRDAALLGFPKASLDDIIAWVSLTSGC